MKIRKLKRLIEEKNYEKIIDDLYAYYPKVRALVLKYGGNEHDAKDTFQEGLIILIDKLKSPDFELTCRPETFLYSTCHNVWRVTKRRLNKQVNMEKVNVPGLDHSNIDEHIEKERKFQKLDKVLKSIGDKCREVLQLYYLKKLSMKEIAEKFGFSSTQVAKNQKYKCMERAKKMAAEMDVEHVNTFES